MVAFGRLTETNSPTTTMATYWVRGILKSLSSSAGFLVVITFLVALEPRAANAGTACASSCGKIPNITHPFRLKHDPADCGDHSYELDCVNNVTILQLNSVQYHVEAINYNNYTIRLVDPNVEQTNCSSLPGHFLSQTNFTDTYDYSDYSPWETYEAIQYRTGNFNWYNTTFRHIIYLNCSNPVRDDDEYVETAPCLNWYNSKSQGHIYAVAGDLRAGSFKVGCHVMLVAATSFWGLGSHTDDADRVLYNKGKKRASYNDVHKGLAYGFELSWLLQACRDLHPCQDDDDCYFDAATETLQCFESICDTPLGFQLLNTSCGNN